jgi:para-nitrobenzyl esterase
MKLLLVIILEILYYSANGVVVKLTDGLIQGYSKTINGVQTNIFKGIPFAAPPLADQRFSLPQRPSPWKGILNVTKYKAACLTNSTVTQTVQNVTSEDCLYLNLFADSRCSVFKPCPIVFFVRLFLSKISANAFQIHGGAFQGDSAIMFNETQLLNKYASDRFIFVLPSYRLGIFGLLDLGEEIDGSPYNVAVYGIFNCSI